MKEIKRETHTYKLNKEWYCDIVRENARGIESYCAWIYHKDYGIKSLMFGERTCDTTLSQFEETVYTLWRDYAQDYAVDYMD